MRSLRLSIFCLSLILSMPMAYGQQSFAVSAPSLTDKAAFTSTSTSATTSRLRATNATNKSSNRFEAEWRLSLAGRDKSDLQSQAKMVDFRMDLKATYLLSSQLLLDLQPSFRLQSGQTQSINGADKADNKILLNQVAAHYSPFAFLQLSAGAMDQRALHTSLLMDQMAFPAARMQLQSRNSQWLGRLLIESAIPTSTSMSTNTRELEPTPAMNALALQFQWQPASRWAWKNSLSYFAYSNLPSAVAKDSNLLGNEVEEITSAEYRFRYAYEGIEAATQLSFPVTMSLDLYFGGEYLQNTGAPAPLNTAHKYFMGGHWDFSKNLRGSLEGSYFEIAPEAAVAYFNAGTYETNRVGYALESSVSFKRQGFKVGLRYSDADLMYIDKDQSRQKSLIIKLETFYANI